MFAHSAYAPLFGSLQNLAAVHHVALQALQLLLLRRFAQQVLGPLISTAVPKLLLADASRCGEAASLRMLRELQALAAFPKAALDGGKPTKGRPVGSAYNRKPQVVRIARVFSIHLCLQSILCQNCCFGLHHLLLGSDTFINPICRYHA